MLSTSNRSLPSAAPHALLTTTLLRLSTTNRKLEEHDLRKHISSAGGGVCLLQLLCTNKDSK
ncbi:hypothetical protein MUK42_22262 [Musa troglodytarum]|uniref:Uncharacterized protein n=1 Tax=Musa troglodytarum TaxID=320322 RepID=A0A9E7I8D1_9LILI|nr:hypothetical protein MUK42_22262 [Musa troglodytarum]